MECDVKCSKNSRKRYANLFQRIEQSRHSGGDVQICSNEWWELSGGTLELNEEVLEVEYESGCGCVMGHINSWCLYVNMDA